MKKIYVLGMAAVLLATFINFSPAFASTFPDGCTSSSGFSTTTGEPCAPSSIQPTTTPPPVCTPGGYDSRTGFKCGCTSTSGFSTTTGEPCGVSSSNPGPIQTIIPSPITTTPPLGFTTASLTLTQPSTFTRDLTIGSVGEDVRALQQYLNSHDYTIATSGVGSSGNESTTFGSLTQAALIRFQQAKGITPALGYFGAITRGVVSAE